MRKKMRLLLTFLAILSFTGPTFAQSGEGDRGILASACIESTHNCVHKVLKHSH